jgi:ribosome-associated protein
VLARLGPVVRAIAADERSQLRNRELATRRVLAQLEEAARPRRPRVPTAPTPGSREQRLETKRRQAVLKWLRRAPDEPD